MPEGSARPRLRLNWFSPLPPARTDIAHYALRTLPALARHAEVVVWTDGSEWPNEIEAYASVRRWDGEPWRELNAADATVYHIGNDARFHGWIWDVARRHPGIVVLHDTRLHEFFAIHLLENCLDSRAYLSAVRRCHGEAALLEAERLLTGEVTPDVLAEPFPMTELAVERARGAVVHTTTAFEQVVALQRCSVQQLDLPFSPGSPPPPRQWEEGPLRLVVFGYLGANRGIDELLQAMASFSERQRLRLEIFGQLENPDSIAEAIQALGIGEIVEVRGFVPEEELDAALERSHLAVNLRHPTMGEASGSQLRIWSRGLASVVTRSGWYAELPAETAWFIDPGNEVAGLHDHFRTALADPGMLKSMGAAGRRHLEARHDPALYAGELVTGIEQMMRTPASVLSDSITTVARILKGSGLTPSAKATLADRAAVELCRWIGTPSRET